MFESTSSKIIFTNSIWINNLSRLHQKYNINIKLKTKDLPIHLRYKGTVVIYVIISQIKLIKNIRRFDTCRLYMQVIFISEIINIQKTEIQLDSLRDERDSLLHSIVIAKPSITKSKKLKTMSRDNKILFYSTNYILTKKCMLGQWK